MFCAALRVNVQSYIINLKNEYGRDAYFYWYCSTSISIVALEDIKKALEVNGEIICNIRCFNIKCRGYKNYWIKSHKLARSYDVGLNVSKTKYMVKVRT